MGQGQSRDEGPQANGPRKTCYYELLDIPMSATDAEIKKAYRKKALELHPDRNHGDTENATRLFAEVQTAYEILSNPHERDWYDAHREEILSGAAPGDGDDHYEQNVRVTTAEDITRMYMSFDGQIRFDDSPNGFYTELRKFFERLALEETLASEQEDEEAPIYPTFGTADSDYATEVRPFYAAWSGFATCKSFAWKNMYRLSEAPDRRIRRLMEKENKKTRDQAIRDFNSAVRALVSFVRRRDLRHIRGSTGAQAGEDLHTALRQQAAMQAAKAREANRAAAEAYVTPNWAQNSDAEVGAGDISDESESEPEEILECIVCKKTFKSESQFKAHEQSKKHRKAVHDLERRMRKENKALGLDSVPVSTGDVTPIEVEENEVEGDAEADEVHLASQPDPSQTNARLADHPDENSVETLADSLQHSEPLQDLSNGPSNSSGTEDDAEFDTDLADRLDLHTLSSLSDDDEEDYLEEKDLKSDIALQNSATTDKSPDDIIEASTAPRLGKAKQRRAKKEAREATESESTAIENQCNVCRTPFASRSKLFEHIKRTGHARAVGAPVSQGGKTKTNKKRAK